MKLKLHGSIGWERQVAMNGAVQQASAEDKRRVICDHIERLGTLGPVEMTPSRQRSPWLPTIPAIAVPLQTKLKFECPDDHVERLKEELPAVRSVLCIGWRAGEQAFLDLAQEYCPNVLSVTAVCGRMEDSQATTSVLQRVFPRAAMEPIGSGFTDAIGTRQLMGAIVRAWPLERETDWPELELASRRPDGPASALRR